PMSHTHNTSTIYIMLNGEKMSEFMLYSWACASCGCRRCCWQGTRCSATTARIFIPR
ncbi:MAG: M55 family metallopeptidase, partial [Firmicutes bacterium]|nr:M55 family metallopeptidase [Bacillota bacterium]